MRQPACLIWAGHRTPVSRGQKRLSWEQRRLLAVLARSASDITCLLPEEGTSLLIFDRGIGVLVRPLLAGLASELFKGASRANFPVMGESSSYVVIFLVTSVFLSMPFLRHMKLEKESHR